MKYCKLHGLSLILFGTASFWGMVLLVITYSNVIAFCTIVSVIAFFYSLYEVCKVSHVPSRDTDNIISHTPRIDTTEPDFKPDFNNWIKHINSQL